jgi:Peroxidase, family 2
MVCVHLHCLLSQSLIFFNKKIVTGEHSFIPPNFNAGDQRGPCPGLNALANHGYIERNGVTHVRRKCKII